MHLSHPFAFCFGLSLLANDCISQTERAPNQPPSMLSEFGVPTDSRQVGDKTWYYFFPTRRRAGWLVETEEGRIVAKSPLFAKKPIAADPGLVVAAAPAIQDVLGAGEGGVPSTGCRDAFPKVFTNGILP